MNPGSIHEEAAKVANTTVEALKQTPMTLALVVFNVLFMFLTAYISVHNSSRADRELERMHELVAKTLSACKP